MPQFLLSSCNDVRSRNLVFQQTAGEWSSLDGPGECSQEAFRRRLHEAVFTRIWLLQMMAERLDCRFPSPLRRVWPPPHASSMTRAVPLRLS